MIAGLLLARPLPALPFVAGAFVLVNADLILASLTKRPRSSEWTDARGPRILYVSGIRKVGLVSYQGPLPYQRNGPGSGHGSAEYHRVAPRLVSGHGVRETRSGYGERITAP
jgi:hypothetical protein